MKVNHRRIKQVLFFSFFIVKSLGHNGGNKVEETTDPYLKIAYSIEEYAKKFQSTKYVWGGKKPGGFDCSGLVHFCFKKFGMNLTQPSFELAKLGYEVPPMGALPGDLIFFKRSSHGQSPVSHVGIILEAGPSGVKFIHAARNQGVVISYLHEEYYTKHFVSVKRVIDQLKNYSY